MDKVRESIIKSLSLLNLGKDYSKESLLVKEIMEEEEDSFTKASVSIVLASLYQSNQISTYTFSIESNQLKIVYIPTNSVASYTTLILNISDLIKGLDVELVRCASSHHIET